jgi:L-alanine-DL-glutamate epimerase-like enolase superfamily enzyme
MPFELWKGHLRRPDVGGILLQAFTDEETTGVCCPNGNHTVLRIALEDLFKPLLVGQSPLDVSRLWETIFAAWKTHGIRRRGGAAIVGAIDIALWDILGKLAGLPVCRLLGTIRETVPVYIDPSMK